jgi:alkylhydroperoxidase family enzyme
MREQSRTRSDRGRQPSAILGAATAALPTVAAKPELATATRRGVMARIRIPDGDKPEIVRVWSLRPELGLPLAELSKAVYGESKLPARVRESVRMRIAQINQCPI